MIWYKSSHSTTNACMEVHMCWRKSSRSGTYNCVEVGVTRTATRSGLSNCVEVEGLPEGWVAVRDNERPDEVIRVSPESWRAFILGVKDGEFDLPG
jgi:hypothetical protein